MNRTSTCMTHASIAALLVVASTSALSAPPERPIRIGFLTTSSEDRGARMERSLVDGLRSLGYVEGKNLQILRRTGQYPDLEPSAKELAGMTLDAIVTSCGYSTTLAVKATNTIPIIMGSVTDPVGYGFVRSLAQPGTNVTGTSASVPGLAPKMLEYLRLALPDVRRVGLIVNEKNVRQQDALRAAQAVSASLNLSIATIEVLRFASEESALEAIRSMQVQAVMALPDDDRHRMYMSAIYGASEKLRVPTFFNKSDAVESGGMLSYGPDSFDVLRHSAGHVDKIANGISPTQLPVEQPTRMEFVINLKQANAFGIAIPRAALLRADWVVK